MALRVGLTRLYSVGGLAAAFGATVVASQPQIASGEKSEPPYLDPEAWERAAKALRDINSQANSKKIFEQLKLEETTKQQSLKSKEAEYKAQAAHLSKEQERVKWEEQRTSQREMASQQAEIKRYEDDLARQRMKSEHELQRQRNAELVKMQEESGRAQEQERLRIEQQIQAERRAAEQYKAELEKQIQRERALAEAEGRIREQRENEDINRRQMVLKYQEQTKLVLQAIGETFGRIGHGALTLVGNTDLLLRTTALSSLLLLGFFSTREGSKVVARAVERWMGTPKLMLNVIFQPLKVHALKNDPEEYIQVRETSRTKPWQFWKAKNAAKTTEEVRKDFGDIILTPELHDHVRALAAVTANTKRHGAPFRHMLFYGPPGTGKTMAAKRLARTSGLDYAIMSGGDVAPLGGASVTQLHAVFDWAERSRRGLLLFIDEADAFLGQRSDAMSEGLRGALNAMLFRTGDQSKDFLVVMATNRPGDLDSAMLDRVDEALMFPLPGPAERRKILDVYLDQYIKNAGFDDSGLMTRIRRAFLALMSGRKATTDKIRLQGITEEVLWQAAKESEGFSGRELAKFMASVQAAVYGTRDATLTPELFLRVLNFKVREHRRREGFRAGNTTGM